MLEPGPLARLQGDQGQSLYYLAVQVPAGVPSAGLQFSTRC